MNRGHWWCVKAGFNLPMPHCRPAVTLTVLIKMVESISRKNSLEFRTKN